MIDSYILIAIIVLIVLFYIGYFLGRFMRISNNRNKKKYAYICSPYAASKDRTVKDNKQYARRLTRWAIDNNYVPITVHLYLTECTNDDNQDERKLGMSVGLELIKKVDTVIVGVDYHMSDGMKAEISESVYLGKCLKFIEIGKDKDENN